MKFPHKRGESAHDREHCGKPISFKKRDPATHHALTGAIPRLSTAAEDVAGVVTGTVVLEPARSSTVAIPSKMFAIAEDPIVCS